MKEFLGIHFGEKLDSGIRLMQEERSLSLISLLGPRSLSLMKKMGKCGQFSTLQLSRNLSATILSTQVWNVMALQGAHYSFLELYVKYQKQFSDPTQPFNDTHCNIEFMIEDFVNLMSVTYNKGHFILGAEFNESSVHDLYPDIGTETGVCKTIKPSVRRTCYDLALSQLFLEFKY